jgi:hypothetical protein
MTRIIAARFDTFDGATAAATRLFDHGVGDQDMQIFYVNPGGRHAKYPIGGDQAVDKHSRGGGSSSALASALSGVLFGLFGAWIVSMTGWHWATAIIFAGVGAYLGAFYGATFGLGRLNARNRSDFAGRPEPAQVRLSGVVLAVRVARTSEATVIAALEQAGGESIERANGSWRDGKWVDFDPSQPPDQVPMDTPGQHQEQNKAG